MANASEPFYHLINLQEPHHEHCYLKVRISEENPSSCTYIENRTKHELCLIPVLDASHDWVYSPNESIFAGVSATLQAIAGVILNLLVFAVFLRFRTFRKEYLTPFILSLATTDLIYSLVTLPIIAARNFAG